MEVLEKPFHILILWTHNINESKQKLLEIVNTKLL